MRAARSHARAIEYSFTSADDVGTPSGYGVNSCDRLSWRDFECEIENDFDSDYGGTIACTSDVVVGYRGTSQRVGVAYVRNSAHCEWA